MLKVPFYPNHEDDMHCEMAAYASVIDNFLQKKLTWPELEQLVGYKEGIAAWTVEALPKLSDMGLDIVMIEPFDYGKYLDQGESYLSTLYSPEEIDWYYEHSNIKKMKQFIPEFQKSIKHQTRSATLKDIDKMLEQGRLVFVTVNSRALNGRAGFVSHALLVIDKQDGAYVTHDSGLPPIPYRKVSADLLWKSMGGNENTAEVTGFRLANNV